MPHGDIDQLLHAQRQHRLQHVRRVRVPDEDRHRRVDFVRRQYLQDDLDAEGNGLLRLGLQDDGRRVLPDSAGHRPARLRRR